MIKITQAFACAVKKRAAPALLIALALLALLLINVKETSASALSALVVCAKSIIPGLFPFMVLSGFALSSGADRFMRGGKLFYRLFKVPGARLLALALGGLCGFPAGAKTAIELYEKGSLTKSEAERLLPLANLTGPGFAVGAAGLLLGSAAAGWVLYALQIAVTMAVCALLAPRGAAGAAASGAAPGSSVSFSRTAAFSGPGDARLPVPEKKDLSAAFTGAVRSASLSCLYICGYVVFFSCVSSALGSLVFPGEQTRVLRALLSCFLEVGGGVAAAAGLNSPLRVPLCAFALGFSGISVMSQIASFNKSGLSLKPLFSCKLLAGALCALAAYLLILLGVFD